MEFRLDFIEDKVEFFEAEDLKTLEKKINDQIDANKALLLYVKSVSHQMYVDPNGRRFYSAVVHFTVKK